MLEPTEDEKRQSAVIQLKRTFSTLQTQAKSLLVALDNSILGVKAEEIKAALGDADFDLVRERLTAFTKEPDQAEPAQPGEPA